MHTCAMQGQASAAGGWFLALLKLRRMTRRRRPLCAEVRVAVWNVGIPALSLPLLPDCVRACVCALLGLC